VEFAGTNRPGADHRPLAGGSSLGTYYYFRDQTGIESHDSVCNTVQPENEPQENVKDLAARLEALQRDVQDIKALLGLPPG
jgi:hypothetical protein